MLVKTIVKKFQIVCPSRFVHIIVKIQDKGSGGGVSYPLPLDFLETQWLGTVDRPYVPKVFLYAWRRGTSRFYRD